MCRISYALYILRVFVLKHEMQMRTFIDQYRDICCSPLIATCPLFLVDSLSVIWYQQYLAAVSVIWKEGKCLCSCPRNASIYPTFLLSASDGTLLVCVLSGCCLFAEERGSSGLDSVWFQSPVCLHNSALKSPGLSFVKGGVDAGVVSLAELMHCLALKSGGFCVKLAAEAGFITKNL